MRQGISLAVILLLTSQWPVQAQTPPDWGATRDVVQIPPPQRLSSKVFSKDGGNVATVRVEVGKRAGSLQVWNANTGSLVCSANEPVNGVFTFSPDDKTLAGKTADYNLGLWDAATGKLRQTLQRPFSGPGSEIDAVAFSPDGKLIAIGGSGYGANTTVFPTNPGWNAPGFISIVDAGTGKLVRILRENQGAFMSVAFSPDGKLICGGSWLNTVRIWNAQTGELIRTMTFDKNTLGVRSVAISPDGKLLATGTGVNRVGVSTTTGAVQLWDLDSGGLLKTLADPGSALQISQQPSLAFSSDGKTLACAGASHCVILWAIPSGQQQYALGQSSLGDQRQYAIAFVPHGLKLADEMSNGQLQISVWGRKPKLVK